MKFVYLTVLVFASTVVGQAVFYSGLSVRKCVDLAHKSVTSNNPVVIFDCNGTPAQKWTEDNGTISIHYSAAPHWCVDVIGSPQIGSPVVINACSLASDSQRFYHCSTTQHIKLESTDLCIAVPNGDTTNYNQLQLRTCVNSPSQVWVAPPFFNLGKEWDTKSDNSEWVLGIHSND